jgi:diketogulonate reductase-like aldo/keto reductase
MKNILGPNRMIYKCQAYSSLGTSSSEKPLLSDPTISNVARKYGKSSAQVLLKFAIQV